MLFRLVSYLWLFLTLFLLLKPVPGYQHPVLFDHEDKLAHFLLFFNLSLLWDRELRVNFHFSDKNALIFVVVAGVTLAGLTEWAQNYIPYRGMDLADFLFDIAGLVVGIFVVLVIQKQRHSLSK